MSITPKFNGKETMVLNFYVSEAKPVSAFEALRKRCGAALSPIVAAVTALTQRLRFKTGADVNGGAA